MDSSKVKKRNKITRIFTDGACSGNPGVGGWGAVVLTDKKAYQFSGYSEHTTNNQMELLAVIKGLTFAKRAKQKIVHIYSDSAYVVNAITKGWLYSWQASDWKKSDGEQVKNSALWAALYMLITGDHFEEVKFYKVKGHSGHHFNEMADTLAREAVSEAKASKGDSDGTRN